MLVSLNWLNDYIDVSDLSAEQVAAALTDIGLEVEGITKQSAVPDEVIVGEVVSAVKHPNADSLRCCKVSVGQGEPLDIVCGAPNARAGIKVAVAMVGASLPGDFKIKKSKIRGEVSCGMLCSEKELELSESHAGIIELPADAKLGEKVARVLGLGDTVVEIKVTPNRADCLGYLGLARDLSAKLKRTFKEPLPELVRDDKLASDAHVTVKIADDEASGRFVALYVKDVAAIPSPAWMQKRLTASGMRPINLIVDASNYAMLEYSQPIHTYDERHVRGKLIEVRPARAGEKLTTLDGQERTLVEGDTLICDAEGPIGLAGVMGGQNSEIRDDTRNVIIEVASFSGRRIRKTARRLGLHTEASHRFERGTDIDAIPRVALRTAELLVRGATEAGHSLIPKVARDLVDVYPGAGEKRVIALRLSRAKEFLSLPQLKRDDVVQILTALEFTLLDSTDDRMVFEVPYFRGDVEREVDLIEEVGRIYGFDKIQMQLPVMSIRPTLEDPFIDFQEQARAAAAAEGLRETVTFPFVGAAELEALGVPATHPLYPTLSLANPLNEQMRLMQTTLVPGLLRAAQANRRQGERGVRLFEVGRGYFAPEAVQRAGASAFWKPLVRQGRHVSRRARGEQQRPVERQWLAAVIDQPFLPKRWDGAEEPATFYHGKAAVLGLLKMFGTETPRFQKVEAADVPWLHPGAAAAVYLGSKAVGWVGELHPKAALALDLSPDNPPILLELDLEGVFDGRGKALNEQEAELRRFPPITRDFAFVADQARTHADFEAAVKGFKRKRYLSRFELFDVYAGDNLPAGKKSMAYTFHFQSLEKTLSDQEVEPEIQALLQHLGETLQVQHRG